MIASSTAYSDAVHSSAFIGVLVGVRRRFEGFWPASLLAAMAFAVHAASVDPALPAYEPHALEASGKASWLSPEGAVTVVGYNDMRDMLEPLAARFSAAHPEIRFQLVLPGTRFAPEALAKGESAFAPMGAEFTPPQLAAYRALQREDPVAFRVAHASLDARALSGPLAVFVHRDNPLASLTLEQVSRVFAGEARRWGDLGIEGPWAQRPITSYGMSPGTALAYAFKDMAMGERSVGAQMRGLPQSADVAQRVSQDPNAIGFAAAMRATGAARVLALAARAGAEPVVPTEEGLVAGRYPLDRYLLIYVPRPVPPVAREFLRLVLSREGQQAVASTPQKYLPLSATDAAKEMSKLELLK
jgi:phosphate transport system substrate-binding protein